MTKPEYFKDAKRRAAKESGPSINLETCRVDQDKGREGHRFIITGEKVEHGVAPPMIDIGGHKPSRIVYAPDGKTAVGFIPSSPQSDRVLIDYGFANGSCKIEGGFASGDPATFKAIMGHKPPVRKSSKGNFLQRFLRKILKNLSSPGQNRSASG